MGLLVAWVTAAVYCAGVAMILIAFGYCYQPGPRLRTFSQCVVLAAVALAAGSAILAWHGQMTHSRSLPAAAIAGEQR
jgi:hypothetical protein